MDEEIHSGIKAIITLCLSSPQRLREYQRRLDLSSLKQNENPIVLELKVGHYTNTSIYTVVANRRIYLIVLIFRIRNWRGVGVWWKGGGGQWVGWGQS